MLNVIRRHPARTAVGVVTVLAGLAWVAFGFFGVHTLFVDDVVSEAAPVFDSQPASAEPATASPAPEPAPEPASPATAPPTAAPTEPSGSPQPAEPAPDEPDVEEPADAPAEIVTELTGSFVSDAHPTAGTAVVLGNGTDQRFLRFEDFETDNGPDLNVYLRDPDTGDFVDLGDLKGNIGEQNYEIPADVDLERFSVVDIWCVRFGVGFGNAQLTPTS